MSIKLDLINMAKRAREIYPEWRYGQAVFNTCHSLFPEIADSLRGTEYDPFYEDTRVEAFLQQVEEKLSASSNG